MGTSYPERIPLNVFIVSSHSIAYLHWEFTDLKEGCEWDTVWIGSSHGSGSNCDSVSFPKKTASWWFCIDVCVFNIQALLYSTQIKDTYWVVAFAFEPMNPQNLASLLEDPEAFYRRVSKIERMEYSSLALSFASIFAVKICFLLFFHEMITRLRRLILAWKVIFGITILFWALCTCAVFIGCPHFSPTSSK